MKRLFKEFSVVQISQLAIFLLTIVLVKNNPVNATVYIIFGVAAFMAFSVIFGRRFKIYARANDKLSNMFLKTIGSELAKSMDNDKKKDN